MATYRADAEDVDDYRAPGQPLACFDESHCGVGHLNGRAQLPAAAAHGAARKTSRLRCANEDIGAATVGGPDFFTRRLASAAAPFRTYCRSPRAAHGTSLQPRRLGTLRLPPSHDGVTASRTGSWLQPSRSVQHFTGRTMPELEAREHTA